MVTLTVMAMSSKDSALAVIAASEALLLVATGIAGSKLPVLDPEAEINEWVLVISATLARGPMLDHGAVLMGVVRLLPASRCTRLLLLLPLSLVAAGTNKVAALPGLMLLGTPRGSELAICKLLVNADMFRKLLLFKAGVRAPAGPGVRVALSGAGTMLLGVGLLGPGWEAVPSFCREFCSCLSTLTRFWKKR
jgi:hypothetical protein